MFHENERDDKQNNKVICKKRCTRKTECKGEDERFKVPVKVEQIHDDLFSDTVK